MVHEQEKNIDDYLDGILSPIETAAFEESVRQDPKLAHKVAEIREINLIISQEAEMQSFLQKIEQLNEKYFPIPLTEKGENFNKISASSDFNPKANSANYNDLKKKENNDNSIENRAIQT